MIYMSKFKIEKVMHDIKDTKGKPPVFILKFKVDLNEYEEFVEELTSAQSLSIIINDDV